MLPKDQRPLSDQQLRVASDEQLQDLIARVDLLLRSKGQSGLPLDPSEDERDTPGLPIPQTRFLRAQRKSHRSSLRTHPEH